MNKLFKISIVVPIYNAKKQVSQCIKSILAQDYNNFELILINDGSKDNSLEICKSFSKLDSRIILIDQINQGVSISRNNGIKVATGEYILFVDADDYLAKDYITSFLKEQIDSKTLIIQDLIRVENGKNIINDNYIYQQYNLDNLAGIFQNNILKNGYPFCKLYNLNIIKENKIRFNPDIKFGEDLMFFLEYLKYIDRIKFVNKHKYFYLIHKESASFKNFSYIEMVTALNQLLNIYRDLGEFYNLDVINKYEVKNSISLFLTLTLYTIYDPRNNHLYKGNRIKYLKKFAKSYDLNFVKNTSIIKQVYIKLLQYKLFAIANTYLNLYVKYRLKINK